MIEQRHDLQFLEAVGPQPENEAEQAEAERGQHQERQHPERMRDPDRHEQARGRQDDEAEHDRLGRRRADIAEHDLERRHRRRENFVDGADEARKIDAERGVRHALRQQHQHDQAGHDEGAVADALDLGDARADRGAEHDEIERRRDHRRDDALQQRAPGSRHFVNVDRAHGVEVHGARLPSPGRRKCPRASFAWSAGP